MKKNPLIRFQLLASDDMMNWLKAEAQRKNISVSALIRIFIAEKRKQLMEQSGYKSEALSN